MFLKVHRDNGYIAYEVTAGYLFGVGPGGLYPGSLGSYGVGRMGSSTVRIGDLVYVAESKGIRAFDVTEAGNPIAGAFLSPVKLGERVRQIGGIADNLILAVGYVTLPDGLVENRLSVYEMDGEAFSKIGQAAGNYLGTLTAVNDNVAIFIDHDQVNRVDLSNPERPRILSSVTAPRRINAAALNGSTLVIALEETVPSNSAESCDVVCDEHTGLLVYDVSTPGAPVQIGKWNVESYIDELEFANGMLYAIDRWYGLRIFDLSDPGEPIEVTTFRTTRFRAVYRNLAVVGDVVMTMVSSTDLDGLVLIDVSDPLDPVQMDVNIPEAYPIGVNSLANLDGDGWFIDQYRGAWILEVSNLAGG